MKSIQKYISTQSTLASLGEQLTRQADLMKQVKACLTPPLDDQLQAAVLKDQVLSLFVNSPAWASRLRYLAPQLLRQLKQAGVIVHEVRTRIIPEANSSLKSRHRHRPLLSEASAESLRSIAECLEAGALREAVLRLSRHSQKKGPR